MAPRQTAVVSKNMWGEQDYQARAREAMPILVRQALSANSIFYEDLAGELGMPNPRNLNYPLGSVGQTLLELSERWGTVIPPIQCLVVNQADGIPGEGFGWFMPDRDGWKRLSKFQRRNLVEGVLQQIYAYPRWPEVLAELNLAPATVDYKDLVVQAARMGGGEGEEHRRLKEHVSRNPQLVKVSKRSAPGEIERWLPSGDALDVFFDSKDEWVGVEVKPATSGLADVTRGLFQCVKYQAVLRAMAVVLQKGVSTRTVLVLGGRLPSELEVLRAMLGIDVVEGVAADRLGGVY